MSIVISFKLQFVTYAQSKKSYLTSVSTNVCFVEYKSYLQRIERITHMLVEVSPIGYESSGQQDVSDNGAHL